MWVHEWLHCLSIIFLNFVTKKNSSDKFTITMNVPLEFTCTNYAQLLKINFTWKEGKSKWSVGDLIHLSTVSATIKVANIIF